MEQETKNKAIPKEFVFSISDTQIVGWTSVEAGILISGKTNFTMNIDTDTSGASRGTCYIVPDFQKELKGTFKLDADTEFIELKDVPIDEAKKTIHAFLIENPGSRTSDIILKLGIDPDIVLDALSQLRCEDKVEGRAVGGK